MNPPESADQGASPPQRPDSGKKKEKKEKEKKEKKPKAEKDPQSGQKLKAEKDPQPGQKPKAEKDPQPGQKPKADKESQSGQKPKAEKDPKPGQKPKEGEKPANQGKEGAQAATGDGPQLSKAELRKMRKEKQEADRAAKAAKGAQKQAPKKEPGGQGPKKEPARVPDSVKADVPEAQKRIAKKLEKQQIPKRTTAQRKVRLFNHIQQYERETSLTQSLQFGSGGIHPSIIKLGLQYAEGVISGSNARCVALLAALKLMIADYSTPQNEELCRDLAAKLKPNISFLSQCRPLSVSMGNAIKTVKWHITQTPGNIKDNEAKDRLFTAIDDFQSERIVLAAEGVSNEASAKIADGDVILVYGCSSLVRRVLCDAHKHKKKFHVIVADGRPKMAGKEMLRRLVKEGITCSYVLINAVSYVMTEATKVILGAHGLLANGFVMSTVGTSLVALIAKSSNVPVLVCCETYKFCDRVQTDSFVFNELGDPDDLVNTGKNPQTLRDWRDHSSLTLLNLVYDFTAPEFVTMVITELGMMPCTSVPVVLRRRQQATSET